MKMNDEMIDSKTMERQPNEMGYKSIKKLFLKMAIPTVIAQIINLMYSLINRVYIGHIYLV
jgi:Na+-driven multidrug efflux pump